MAQLHILMVSKNMALYWIPIVKLETLQLGLQRGTFWFSYLGKE